VVQATVDVDVDAPVEEPPQAVRVLEVQLVEDQPLEARLVEQVEEPGVRALAGVIERVLVPGRATLDKELDEREVAALDSGEQGRHATWPPHSVVWLSGSAPASSSSWAQRRTSAGAPVDCRSKTSNGASPSTSVVAIAGSAPTRPASAEGSATAKARSMPSRVLACT
jgi:hypothetical protein